PGRPKASQASAREEHFLRIATDEFLEHGYGSASLSRMARTAGVSTRTVYAHYAGKDDILMAVASNLANPIREDAIDALNKHELDPRSGLGEFGFAIARHWTSASISG